MAKGTRDRWWTALGLLALAAIGLGVGWSLCRPKPPVFRGAAVTPPHPAPDFSLVDQSGRPFQFGSLRGKVIALYFGYTFCPDVCPSTLLVWRQARQMLGPQADRVAFVFVSVDPERDSPQRVRDYLTNFDASFIGLTGKPPQVAEVLRQFGVYAEKVEVAGTSAAGYLMSHSASTYLVDAQGMMRDVVFYGATADDLVHDLRQLL